METLKFIFISSQVTTVRCNIYNRQRKTDLLFSMANLQIRLLPRIFETSTCCKIHCIFHLVIGKSIIKFSERQLLCVGVLGDVFMNNVS